MTVTALLTRLRIRNAADDADLLVVSSERGGTNPYLADEVVRADGQSVNPLTGKVTVEDYVLPVIDAVGATLQEVVVWREDFGLYANDAAFTAVWTGDDDPQNLATFALSTVHVNPSAKAVLVDITGASASGSGIHAYRTRVVSGLVAGQTYHYYRRIYDTGRFPTLADNAWTVFQGADRVADGSGQVTIEVGFLTVGAGVPDPDDHWEGEVWLTTDALVNARVVTAILADTSGKIQVLGHRAHYEENADGAGWTSLIDGFVTEAALVDGLRWDIHVGGADRFAQGALFTELDRTLAEPSCLLGGPIVGGFDLMPDFGRPIFRVSAVTAATHITLTYVSGPLPPVKTLQGGWVSLTGGAGASPALAQKILNAAAAPFSVPTLDYVSEPRYYVYPDLTAELYDAAGARVTSVAGAQRGVAGEFTPISVPQGGPDAGLLAGPSPSFTLDWAASQPSVGARYSVLLYARRCTALSPYHFAGHPVDLAVKVCEALEIPYDATSATATRATLGGELWVSLRPTAPTSAATVLQNWLFGPFGFAMRVASDGERAFYATRYRPSTDPADTIDDTLLRDLPSDVWRASESSICNKIVWNLDRYRPVSIPPAGASIAEYQRMSLDGLEQAAYTVTVESAPDIGALGKAGSIAYDLPGTVGRPFIGGWATNVGPTLDALSAEIFALYGRGCPEQVLTCLRGVTAEVGALVIVDLDYLPSATVGQVPTMRRGGAKVIQVVHRTEDAAGPVLTVWDAGPLPSGAPAPLVPELTAAASAGAPKKVARFTVTNITPLAGTGYVVRMEYGTGASEPTEWTLLGYVLDSGLAYVDTPYLNAGTHAWGRGRLERTTGGLAQLGEYGATADVDLADLTAPSALSATAVNATTADLAWTNGEALVPVAVDYKLQADSVWVRAAKLAAGSVAYRLVFPTASDDYDIQVYHEEEAPSTGVSSAATTTFSTTATLPTLAAPTGPIGSGGNGTYRLTVVVAEALAVVEFEAAEETAVGAGTYGSYTRYAVAAAENVGTTVAGEATAPQDGKRRRLRAKHTADGWQDSAYTDTVDVQPWADVAPPKPEDPTVGTNLLLNGDAEWVKTVNWRNSPAGWARVDTDSAVGGWCWEAAGDIGDVEDDKYMGVDPSGRYELTALLKQVTDTDGGAHTVGLACYDEGYTLLGTVVPMLLDALAASATPVAWALYRGTLRGEDDSSNLDDTMFRFGTKYVRVVLALNVGATGTGSVVRVDNLDFHRSDEPLYTLYAADGILAAPVAQAGTDGTGRALVKGKQTGRTHHGAPVTFAPAFAQPPAVRLVGGLVTEPRPMWGSVAECSGATINSATAATPIACHTAINHGLSNGDTVSIFMAAAGAPGLTGLLGVQTVTVTGVKDFTIDGSTGVGTYGGGAAVSMGRTAFDATASVKDASSALNLTGSGFTTRALLQQRLGVALTPRAVGGAGASAVTKSGTGVGGTDAVDLGTDLPAYDDEFTATVLAYIEAEGLYNGGLARLTLALDTDDGSGWVEREQFTVDYGFDVGTLGDNGTETKVRTLTVAGLDAHDDVRLRVVSFTESVPTASSDWHCGLDTGAGVAWNTAASGDVYVSKTPEGADDLTWEAEGYL